MPISKEVEKVIAQLPQQEAAMLRHWLKEFEAARRYRQIKEYAIATEIVVNFERANSDSSLN